MIVTVLGKTGMGKSYFARRLAVGLADDAKLVIFTDNEEDIEEFSPFADVAELDLWSTNYKNWDYGDLLAKYDTLGIVFMDMLDEEKEEVINEVSRQIRLMGNAVLYIDEAHKFFPYYNPPIELSRLVVSGRKLGVDIIFVTQQASANAKGFTGINPTALKQSQYLVLFKLTDPRELKFISQYIDPAVVYSLKPYQCIVMDLLTNRWTKTTADAVERWLM